MAPRVQYIGRTASLQLYRLPNAEGTAARSGEVQAGVSQ